MNTLHRHQGRFPECQGRICVGESVINKNHDSFSRSPSMNRLVALKTNKIHFVITIIIISFFHYICVRNNLIFLEAVNTITLAKFKMAVHAHATVYDVDFKTTCLQHQPRTRTTKAPPIGRLVLIPRRRTQLAHSNCTVYCRNVCSQAL